MNTFKPLEANATPAVVPTDNGNKLLDVHAVASICDCSPRHVYRLADSGKLPPPIKLGKLVRWPAVTVQNWINQGCPSIRNLKGGSTHG